eukprot:XP_788079.4 PREDICTED: double-strand break repair protein MRE11A-like [Strongylocentrotus purpuratus]
MAHTSSEDSDHEVPGNMDEGDENTIKILVATDCHVGYMEKDFIRHSDSIDTFEEILQLAQKNKVDMVLIGGNLFHENTPSKRSLHGVMTLLRKYCMGDRPVQIEFLSDQSVNFAASPFPNVNCEDPNLNIDMPIFSIHGNHDDPRGLGTLSALDMLSACGLVNYFGKSTSLESVEISPILIQKGITKLAMFGLGSIRDERLHRMFLSGKISMLRPKQNADSWFNIFVIHQNRAKRSRNNYIPAQFLDNFIDLVIWGREHECLIDPVWNATQNFFISQPGSSIATSLTPGEAVPKHVGLLQVCGKAMKCTKLKLETVRPFYIEDIALQDTTLDRDDVNAFCTEKVEALIQRAEDEHTGNRKQPTLPLIRLQVDCREWYNKLNGKRFGQKFVGRVANKDDFVWCSKRRIQGQTKEDTEPVEDLEEFFKLEALGTERHEDSVCKYFSGTEEVCDHCRYGAAHCCALRLLMEGAFVEKDLIALRISFGMFGFGGRAFCRMASTSLRTESAVSASRVLIEDSTLATISVTGIRLGATAKLRPFFNGILGRCQIWTTFSLSSAERILAMSAAVESNSALAEFLTKQLELLSEKFLGLAVREYVDKEKKEAIRIVVKHQLSQTQGQLMNQGTTKDHIDDEV